MVNEVLTDHELADSADGDNAKLRLMVLHAIQRTVDDVHERGNFPYKAASVTKAFAPAAVSITMDADFQSIGHDGACHAVLGANKYELRWMPPRDMKRAQKGGLTAERPYWYSEGQTTTAGLHTILLYPFANASVDIEVDYTIVAPTITDATGVGSGLPRIPVAYHRSVIYEGTVMRRMKDEGDLRSSGEQKTLYEAGIKAMIRAEIPGKAAQKRMPPYRGAVRHYR